MTKGKKDIIQEALSFNPFFDTDGDGVMNILDCAYLDPKRHGFVSDIGGAIKTRVKTDILELKERTIEGIAGEERREQRKSLKEVEREAYLEEAKGMAQERGKEKAQRKFTKRRIGEGFGEKVEELEEKVDKFAKKAGKHGKGMLEGDDGLSKKSSKKSVRMVTPLTIGIPRKPIPSTKSQLIVPLTISMPKRTKKQKALLDVGS